MEAKQTLLFVATLTSTPHNTQPRHWWVPVGCAYTKQSSLEAILINGTSLSGVVTSKWHLHCPARLRRHLSSRNVLSDSETGSRLKRRYSIQGKKKKQPSKSMFYSSMGPTALDDMVNKLAWPVGRHRTLTGLFLTMVVHLPIRAGPKQEGSLELWPLSYTWCWPLMLDQTFLG